jgi:hypothetical protein
MFGLLDVFSTLWYPLYSLGNTSLEIDLEIMLNNTWLTSRVFSKELLMLSRISVLGLKILLRGVFLTIKRKGGILTNLLMR